MIKTISSRKGVTEWMWEFAPQQKQPNQNPLFIGAKWAKKKEFVQWKIQSVSRNDSHILKISKP